MKINSKGLSLIELVITIVIIAIIFGIAALIIQKGSESYFKQESESDITNQGRYAIEKMAREIRATRSTADITTATAAQYTFTDSDGNAINYQFAGGNLNRNGTLLASNVSNASFQYYDNADVVTAVIANIWRIEIAFTVAKGSDSVAFKVSVHPRNF